MSFFAHQTAAQRYALGRPYFHPLMIEHISAYLGFEPPLDSALDVGCGTGQSTVALRALARNVAASDISLKMLAEASREEGVLYVQAAAERLPFASKSFDLVTVGLAFHWFDRARFLDEARRVLRPGGWLAIYNSGFRGTMRESDTFEGWMRRGYGVRYPQPPRDHRHPNTEEAEAHGFRFLGTERFEMDIQFNQEELVAYLMTHSNVIAAVEEGAENAGEAYHWLAEGVRPHFTVERGTFPFGKIIWYLERDDKGEEQQTFRR